MTYPLKFRKHVLSIRKNEKLTIEETSVRFGIGRATLSGWIKNITPKEYIRSPSKLKPEEVLNDVELYPDDYHYERAQRFGVTTEAMCRALKRFGVSFKKKL